MYFFSSTSSILSQSNRRYKLRNANVTCLSGSTPNSTYYIPMYFCSVGIHKRKWSHVKLFSLLFMNKSMRCLHYGISYPAQYFLYDNMYYYLPLPLFYNDDDDDPFSFLCNCSWCNSTRESLAGTWENWKYFRYLRCLGKASTSKAANFSLVVLYVIFLFELCIFFSCQMLILCRERFQTCSGYSFMLTYTFQHYSIPSDPMSLFFTFSQTEPNLSEGNFVVFGGKVMPLQYILPFTLQQRASCYCIISQY